ncbi:MAG: polyphosphate polymerase domain-containing protein [Planctomycetota bacterium]
MHTAGVSITVAGAGAPRADVDARVELKFVFELADVGCLREVLLRRCRRVSHAGPVSFVSSLYFDDGLLSSCRANLSGVGLRHKTRLRWYDRSEPGLGTVFLETKWRRHRLTGKWRTAIASSSPMEDLRFEDLVAELERAVSSKQRPERLRDLVPVALVRYRREHYILDGGAARLTLDYDLRFTPQLGCPRLSNAFEWRMPEVTLIELKARPGDERLVSGILCPLRKSPGRFSKYVAACQALGFAGRG